LVQAFFCELLNAQQKGEATYRPTEPLQLPLLDQKAERGRATFYFHQCDAAFDQTVRNRLSNLPLPRGRRDDRFVCPLIGNMSRSRSRLRGLVVVVALSLRLVLIFIVIATTLSGKRKTA
jgi:hypothetical protein